MNPGKQFEHDFQSSIPSSVFCYRFRDSASSFGNNSSTRFTPSNICDFLLFDDESKNLFLLELKSVKGCSIPLSNIRKNQIDELTKAGEHNLIAGFVINFREKDNCTIFITIQEFNKFVETLNKKSININDFKALDCIEISNQQKKIHYKYDIESFIKVASKRC